MTIVVSDVGTARIANQNTNGYATNLRLHLYQNDFTPLKTSVVGDFVESSYDGYADTITAVVAITSIGAGLGYRMTFSTFTFVATDSLLLEPIYGYYVTDDGSGDMIWAERDPLAPFFMAGSFTPYTITPRFDISTDSPSIVLTDLGSQRLASSFWNTAGINYVMHLYQATANATATAVIGDFTEADYSGYAPQPLTGPVISSLGAGLGSVMTWDRLLWTPSSSATPNVVNGYYVTTDMGVLMWQEASPSPITLNSIHTTLPIVPRFAVQSGP